MTDLFVEDELGEVYGGSDWTFERDGTWWASFNFGFESQNGIAISGHLWVYIEGSYTLDGERYTLVIDGNTPETFFGDSNETAGTWSIESDTLTLFDDDGSVIVFYRYAESKGAAVKGSDPE